MLPDEPSSTEGTAVPEVLVVPPAGDESAVSPLGEQSKLDVAGRSCDAVQSGREAAASQSEIKPETPGIEPLELAKLNALLRRLESFPERIQVELHQAPDDKKFLQQAGGFLKDAGPTIVAILALTVSFLVYRSGDQNTREQNSINRRQLELKEKEVEDTQVHLVEEILSGFQNKTDTQRTEAATKAAGYGRLALPPVKRALSVEQEGIRNAAVAVLSQMFLQETVPRQELITTLLGWFRQSPNAYLRRSVLACFVQVEDLQRDERQRVNELLKERLGNKAELSNDEDEQVIVEAIKFSTNQPSLDSKEFLLGILENCRFEAAKGQAANYLPKVAAKLPPQEQDDIVARLRQQRGNASDELKLDIDDAISRIEAMKVT